MAAVVGYNRDTLGEPVGLAEPLRVVQCEEGTGLPCGTGAMTVGLRESERCRGQVAPDEVSCQYDSFCHHQAPPQQALVMPLSKSIRRSATAARLGCWGRAKNKPAVTSCSNHG
jgi:hypothetical protein